VHSLVKRLGHLCPFDQVFALSSTEGYGTAALRSHLLGSALPQPWELPGGAPTDRSWKDLAAELVREKCFWAFNHELPYKMVPVCTRCQEFQGNKVEVDVVRSSYLFVCFPYYCSVHLTKHLVWGMFWCVM
jgi:GTPase Era involved in 16S rRNA processing